MAIYDEVPVSIFLFWIQEWDDFGDFGFGGPSGQPLRSGTYLSFDNFGEQPIATSLRDRLSHVIKDEEQMKDVLRNVQDWIEDLSTGAENKQDLFDVFELEQAA